MQAPTPQLYTSFQQAIHILYSNHHNNNVNVGAGVDDEKVKKEAHDFLLQFKRRRRSRTTADVQQENNGSTWIVCLHILEAFSTASTELEIEFVLQVMMFRLRKMKLSESIDLELETNTIANSLSNKLSQLYSYFQSKINNNNCKEDVEATIKGRIALHLLSEYIINFALLHLQSLGQQAQHSCNSYYLKFLRSLATCIVLTSLKLKYQSLDQVTEVGNQQQQLLMNMVEESVDLAMIGSNNQMGNNNYNNNVINAEQQQQIKLLCLLHVHASFPDEIIFDTSSRLNCNTRLSLDPRLHSIAVREIRGDLLSDFQVKASKHLQHFPQNGFLQKEMIQAALHGVERYGSAVPLPDTFADWLGELLLQCCSTTDDVLKESMYRVLDGLCESALLSHEQISAMLVNASEMMDNAQNKKERRHKNKSHKKNPTNKVNESIALEAAHRKETACYIALKVLPRLEMSIQQSLSHSSSKECNDIDHSIRVLCAFAEACLPHLIATASNSVSKSKEKVDLLSYLLSGLQHLCRHNNSQIRSLVYEPLLLLSNIRGDEVQLDEFVVNQIHGCMLALAESCAYPDGYLNDVSLDSDCDLEIERNDVRDVIRALGGTSTDILLRMVESCVDSIQVCVQTNINNTISNNSSPASSLSSCLPPEHVIHALSALAKPLNALSGNRTVMGLRVRRKALEGLYLTCSKLMELFSSVDNNFDLKAMLPVSRLACMASASFSPFISDVVSQTNDEEVLLFLKQTLKVIIHTAILSLQHIPELLAPSSLLETQYDIRGTMRSPGGEDHVGCLVILRLQTESELLRAFTSKHCISMEELCKLHDYLKRSELARGPGIDYGHGVCSKTRHIIIGIISVFYQIIHSDEIHQCANKNNDSSLQEMFRSCLRLVKKSSDYKHEHSSATLFQLCESCLDLAAFSSGYIGSHYNDEGFQDALSIIVERLIEGYNLNHLDNFVSEEYLCQWGRLRAAFFNLLRRCSENALPPALVNAVVLLTRKECEILSAVTKKERTNILFHSEVIGEDIVPAGAFIKLIETSCANLSRNLLQNSAEESNSSITGSFMTLCKALFVVKDIVHPLMLSKELWDLSDTDPRSAVLEAWFASLIAFIKIAPHFVDSATANIELSQSVNQILTESFISVVCLFLFDLGEGVSVDAPQTLLMMEFMSAAPRLVDPFASVGSFFTSNSSHRQFSFKQNSFTSPISLDHKILGWTIFIASLLRGASGRLPPWAIESFPEVFSSIYSLLSGSENNVVVFVQFFQYSLELVDRNTGMAVGGKFIDKCKDISKKEFLAKVHQTAAKNNTQEWKNFKSTIKHLCGGKKKDSGFQLKPSMTSFNCDRI